MIEEIVNTDNKSKVYTLAQIGLATYIGGPLAAGYLMNVNFKTLGKPKKAEKAIVLGILFTILLFAVIFSVPENIMDKVPRFLIPLIYTSIVYFLVEKYQGQELRSLAENKDSLYSIWRAIGIGIVSLAILLAGIFTYFFLFGDNEVYEQYDQQMTIFYENETEALKFYDEINRQSDTELIMKLNKTVIPKWEENIKITERIGTRENLPSELKEQNEAILKYSKLRLKSSKLIKDAILEQTDKYDDEIMKINNEMDQSLSGIKKY